MVLAVLAVQGQHLVGRGRQEEDPGAEARFGSAPVVVEVEELAGEAGGGAVRIQEAAEALELVQDDQIGLERANAYAREHTAQPADHPVLVGPLAARQRLAEVHKRAVELAVLQQLGEEGVGQAVVDRRQAPPHVRAVAPVADPALEEPVEAVPVERGCDSRQRADRLMVGRPGRPGRPGPSQGRPPARVAEPLQHLPQDEPLLDDSTPVGPRGVERCAWSQTDEVDLVRIQVAHVRRKQRETRRQDCMRKPLDAQPPDVLTSDRLVGADVHDVYPAHPVPKVLKGPSDDAAGNEGLAQPHLVGDQESVGRVVVQPEAIEDVVRGAALEVLEDTERLVRAAPGVGHGDALSAASKVSHICTNSSGTISSASPAMSDSRRCWIRRRTASSRAGSRQ